MSQDHEVWVVTNDEHRPYIIRNDQHQRAQWIFVDAPRFLTFWRNGERGRRVHYYLWQVWAYLRVKAMMPRTSFDLIHHVTYVSYWTPSFLALLPLPFLWGPVGGAESTPPAFRRELRLSARTKERLRDFARMAAETLDSFLRMTARRSVVGLATTAEAEQKMRQLGASDVRICSEAALPDEQLERLLALPVRQTPRPFRFISLGRLIGWKAYHLSIRAFARTLEQHPDCEYWLLGTGSEKEHLERLAADLGIGSRICFLGVIPHVEVPQRISECDVLLHPSLHDSGGWTCLEGMAAGRPVICLDLGGPATQVTLETGIKVIPTTPQETVKRFAQSMNRLIQDQELRQRMAAAGRLHVQSTYTWKAKRAYFNQLYDEIALRRT
jgi:glycosyltransferase involved in cell wall biosynthesis